MAELPRLIIVAGPPASGKTTLARRIADELRVPLITKDEIKEVLLESLGAKDVEDSRNLGFTANELIFLSLEQILKAGSSGIVESNFRGEQATDRFLELQKVHDFLPIQIQCFAEDEVLLARYRSRSRHAGHFDHVRLEDLEQELRRGRTTPIGLEGPVIEIDTTDPQKLDLGPLLERLRVHLRMSRPGVREQGATDLKPEDIFSDVPSIETERLILRRASPQDAEDVFAYASDPEVPRFLPWEPHSTIDESKQFLDFVTAGYRSGESGQWGIVLKRSERLIGMIGVHDWNPHNASAEIGYAIGREWWGRGITTEALAALIRFGFEKMMLNRIWARADENNIGSWRVMEKAGMKLEGTIREQEFSKGRFRNMRLYSILRSDP